MPPLKPHDSYTQLPADVELNSLKGSSTPTFPATQIIHEPEPSGLFAKGWRPNILLGAILAIVVFLLNLSVTIFGALSRHNDDGGKVLFQGDCGRAEKVNTAIHFVINVLSTILLSASNYGMQCLSAPTREEVDKAHAQRYWLDIGVLSFRNLKKIAPRRRFLWFLLAMSSVPLHLFFNSAVYSSISSFDYVIYMATEDMLTANATSKTLGVDNFDSLSNFSINTSTTYFDPSYTAPRMYASAVAQNLTWLNVSDCINAYATPFQISRGSLILVTENNTNLPFASEYTTNFALVGPGGNSFCAADAYGWICGDIGTYSNWDCHVDPMCSAKVNSINKTDWRPFGNKIEYCLSEQIIQQCTVEFSPQLAIIVIIFNTLKAAVLVYTFLAVKENPLLTMGDAVSSFLSIRDDTTRGLCLLGKSNVSLWTKWFFCEYCDQREPATFDSTRKRWYTAVSFRRWFFVITLYTIMLVLCIFLLWFGIHQPRAYVSVPTLFSLSLGAIDPRAFIYGSSLPSLGIKGLTFNALLANSPQVILSAIYYIYNGLFTLFLLATEWNSYALQRKGLRVSSRPRGAQRSTYWLQLPKRWAIPLMVLSAILHWLCSQSIFLVRIHFDHHALADPGCNDGLGSSDLADPCLPEFVTCGYSPVAILSTICVGAAMLAFLLVTRSFKFKNGGMPVAGSCSAAISAACHSTGRDQLGKSKMQRVDRLSVHEVPLLESEEAEEGGSLEAGELDAACRPVRWGDMGVYTELAEGLAGEEVDAFSNDASLVKRRRVGHCGFSSQNVDVPQVGGLYAGCPASHTRKT